MSPKVPAPISDSDYAAIEAAVMETARGRWFLAEFVRRNRNADTQRVLDAIAKLEQSLSGPQRTEPQAEQAVPPAALAAPRVERETIDDRDIGPAVYTPDDLPGQNEDVTPHVAKGDPAIIDPEAMLLDWTEDAVPAIAMAPSEPRAPLPKQPEASEVPNEPDPVDLDDILEPADPDAAARDADKPDWRADDTSGSGTRRGPTAEESLILLS